MRYTCAGCRKDLGDTEVYPQGTGPHREYYCHACDKKYSKFTETRAQRLKVLDEQRAKITAQVRAEVFGNGDEIVRTAPVTGIDGKPVDSASVAAMRAQLSSGQVVGQGEGVEGVEAGELEPALEEIVKTKVIKRK